jgi:hypothetical protein
MSATSPSPSQRRKLPTWAGLLALLGVLAAIATIVSLLVQLGVIRPNGANESNSSSLPPTQTSLAGPTGSPFTCHKHHPSIRGDPVLLGVPWIKQYAHTDTNRRSSFLQCQQDRATAR